MWSEIIAKLPAGSEGREGWRFDLLIATKRENFLTTSNASVN